MARRGRAAAPGSRWSRTAAVVVASATMAAGPSGTARAATAPGAATFDSTFDVRGEPASLHYTTTYAAGSGLHRLEVWRKGQTRLRRVTDGALETFVTRRRGGDPEYRMTILDRDRKIATRIDRTNLYRVGNFTDWFDLAHGLKHPRQDYVVSRIPAPAGVAAPVDRCDWYALDSGGAARRVCGSHEYRLPLLIYLDASQAPVWQITTVSTRPIKDSIYRIDDAGFVKNDANQDIEND